MIGLLRLRRPGKRKQYRQREKSRRGHNSLPSFPFAKGASRS
jgi:hypothetical protein